MRNLFWQAEQRRYGNPNPDGLDPALALTVEQDGSQMRWRIVTTVATLGSALHCAAGIEEADVDASVPRSMPLPGDWVVRKGASTDQLAAGIADVLSRKLGRTVRLERRHVTRDAIIVRGSYHFVPLPGKPDNGVIELVGDPPPQPLPSQKRQLKLGELLRRFGSVNGLAIVDETGRGDKPVTIADHPTYGNPMIVLRNIAAQTSLRLDREPRPRDLWFLVDPANSH